MIRICRSSRARIDATRTGSKLEIIRSYLAVTQKREPETISMENVFYYTHRQLVAWNELLGPTLTLEHFAPLHDARKLRRYLTALLKPTWTDRWIKAPSKKNTRPPKQTPTTGGHTSIYRVLQKARDHPK